MAMRVILSERRRLFIKALECSTNITTAIASINVTIITGINITITFASTNVTVS